MIDPGPRYGLRVPLTAVELPEGLLASGSDARRAEWRLASQELLEDHVAADALDGATLAIDLPEREIRLRAGPLDQTIARAAVAKHVSEYVAICLRMADLDEGIASPQLEALDMGKKLAHDDAAKTLRLLLPDFGLDHASARRLFTLLFTLLVDTTNLRTWHLGHRRR